MRRLLFFLLAMLALPIGMLAQGSSWDTATMLNNGGTGSGTLDNNNQDAWFKVEVPEEGKVTITETVDGDLTLYAMYFCNADAKERNREGHYYGSGRTLEVTNVGKGTYYIHVQRSSGSGTFKINYQFTACPYANDSEPNDEAGLGDILENGKTVQGRLGYLDANGYCDKDDWYKIDVPKDGRVQLIFDCDQTYDLKLYALYFHRYKAEDGTYPERTRKGHYLRKDTLTITDVGVGTYYIRVQRDGGHGGYTLKYIFTPNNYANDSEPNDEAGQGDILENGKTVQGHLGYCDATNYTDNNDWYKIEVPKDGRVQLIFDCDQTYELKLYALYFHRYKAEDSTFPERDRKGHYLRKDTLTITDVGVGTYYIRVQRNEGHGGYTLKYIFTPNNYANDSEPNDEAGQGDEIAIGQTVQGHLGYRDATDYIDNNDWYRIEVPKDGQVQLAFDCDQTYELELYALYLHRYKAEDGTYPERTRRGHYLRKDTLTITDVGAGTYYIRVQRDKGHGGYTLKYIFTPNNYTNDTEPNDELEQVKQVIKIDGMVTGHLGYLDANDHRDTEDWFLLKTEQASTLLTVTIEPDTTSTLKFYNVEIVKQKGDKTSSVASKGYYFNNIVTLTVNDVEDDATYYVHLNRSDGHGGYIVNYGAPKRFDGSEIRVSCIGRGTTRLGIPSPMELKVENIGSGHTGSFFLALPVSPDIQILYAELPDKNGEIQRIEHDEFAIYDPNEGDCAVFIMNDLGPYESCKFTIYTQGIVPNLTRGFSLKDKAVAFFSGLKSTTEKIIDNQYFRILTEDGVTHLTTAVLINEGIMTEKDNEQWGQMFGRVPNELQFGYKQPTPHTVTAYTQRIAKVAENLNPAVQVFKILHDVPHGIITAIRRKIWLWIYKDLGYIQDDPQVMDGSQGVNGIVRSWDPNEMVGPVGYGDKNYIGETKTMDYRILFENKAEATDNAYRIQISDVLDEKVFDISTVRFGSTSHEGVEYNWKMKREGNKLSWDIEGIELPPNINAPEGEGYVTFSVDLKPGLANNTQIKNKAAIIFDYNETIETNEYVNTLDLVAPTTKMIAARLKDGVITVRTEGNDNESGINHYLFFASTKGGEFEYIGESTGPAFKTEYNGNTADAPKFYALAVDNAGNAQESVPAAISVTSAGSGDANGDGKVNETDISEIVNYIMGKPSAKFNIDNADISGDAVVDAADIVLIVKKYKNK